MHLPIIYRSDVLSFKMKKKNIVLNWRVLGFVLLLVSVEKSGHAVAQSITLWLVSPFVQRGDTSYMLLLLWFFVQRNGAGDLCTMYGVSTEYYVPRTVPLKIRRWLRVESWDDGRKIFGSDTTCIRRLVERSGWNRQAFQQLIARHPGCSGEDSHSG